MTHAMQTWCLLFGLLVLITPCGLLVGWMVRRRQRADASQRFYAQVDAGNEPRADYVDAHDVEELTVGEVDLTALFHSLRWRRPDGLETLEIEVVAPRSWCNSPPSDWRFGQILPVTLRIAGFDSPFFDAKPFEAVEDGFVIRDGGFFYTLLLVEHVEEGG